MQKLITCGAFMALSLAASQSYAGFEGPSPGVSLGDPTDPFDSFDATIRVGIGHDGNVQLAPDVTFYTTDSGSMFADAELNATYRHRVSSLFVIGAGLRVDGTAFLDEVATALQPALGTYSDYDRVAVNPSVFADFAVDGVDVRLAYGYRFEDAENVHAVGLDQHRASVDLSSDITPTWRIRAGLAHEWNDYDVVFPDPFNDRDGNRTAFNVGADYYIGGGYTVLSATASASINDADGSNWDYAAYGISAGARTVIVPGLFASGEVGYEWRDYDGFQSGFNPPPGRTEHGNFSAKAKLVYAINERFSADAYVAYNDYSSDQPQFEGEQTVVGAGITTKLY